MIILLMVGDGVKELSNLTSESHEGWRCLYSPVVTFHGREFDEPLPDGMAEKNSADITFLATVSRSGSPEGKVNIDDIGE
jgi:hypothetical protein